MAKLWGGRFTGKTDPVMEQFNDSLAVDRVMWAADLDGSIAYSRALEMAKVIAAEEGEAIRGGLEKVRAEWASDTFVVKEGDEDIHTAMRQNAVERDAADADNDGSRRHGFAECKTRGP